jgi:hypothetical protein
MLRRSDQSSPLDGSRCLCKQHEENTTSQFVITLVLNWTAGAAKREARVATATFNHLAAHHKEEISGLTSRG